jgi:uncharacterized membrane protein HdeD (DUF308 family)
LSDALARYFAEEKQGSLVFVAFGVASVVAALVVARTPWKGALWPLLVLGLGAVVVGSTVFLRTDRQVADLQALLARDPAGLKARELPRLERIQGTFRVLKTAEIAVVAAGLALTFVFSRGSTAYAVGIALAVEAAVLLGLDLLASRRADVYAEALRGLS